MDVDLKLLAARVSRGDREAFRSIVDRTKDAMYRLSCRLMGDPSDAEDALQDGYVNAYRALSEGRYSGEARLETWLYRVVTNSCLDAMRRRKARPRSDAGESLEEADAQAGPDTLLALRELDAWLGELPDEQRATVILRCVEGLTTREAAEALGCSEGAVEQRLLRARATLTRRRDERRG